MSKFLEILAIIPPTKKNMEELTEICDKAMEVVQKSDIRIYNNLILELQKIAYAITKEQAETIVKAMKPYGQKWNFEQIKQYLYGKGIDKCFVDYYLVMNMTYNDYYKTAKLVDKSEDTEFYFSLSQNFIEDIDAEPFKVEKYFKQ